MNIILIRPDYQKATRVLIKGSHRSVSALSWGENVGIFVKKISNSKTSVEVVSKKVVSGSIFATDWSEEIMEKISKKLKKL